MAAPRSAFSAALTHPLNALMLGSGVLSAAASGSLMPLIITGVAELAWLFGLSRSASQRRLLALQRGQEAARDTQRAVQVDLRGLSEAERRRYHELELIRKDVHRLAADNSELSAELLQPELAKVDRLGVEFLQVLKTVSEQRRLEQDADTDALVSEAAEARAAAEAAPADRQLADRAQLLEARAERRALLSNQRSAGEAQLSEVEAGLRLLRDQVASLRSPSELGHQLDALSRSVGAVERAVQETEALRPAAAIGQRQILAWALDKVDRRWLMGVHLRTRSLAG